MTVYRDTGDIAHVMAWDEDSQVWHSLCGDPCVTVSDERDYDLIMLNGAPLSPWCRWCTDYDRGYRDGLRSVIDVELP